VIYNNFNIQNNGCPSGYFERPGGKFPSARKLSDNMDNAFIGFQKSSVDELKLTKHKPSLDLLCESLEEPIENASLRHNQLSNQNYLMSIPMFQNFY